MQSSMLYGSENWPARKENEVALQRAKMRMVSWMCGINLTDSSKKRVHSKTSCDCMGICCEKKTMIW